MFAPGVRNHHIRRPRCSIRPHLHPAQVSVCSSDAELTQLFQSPGGMQPKVVRRTSTSRCFCNGAGGRDGTGVSPGEPPGDFQWNMSRVRRVSHKGSQRYEGPNMKLTIRLASLRIIRFMFISFYLTMYILNYDITYITQRIPK